jgi:hypothetical protein
MFFSLFNCGLSLSIQTQTSAHDSELSKLPSTLITTKQEICIQAYADFWETSLIPNKIVFFDQINL